MQSMFMAHDSYGVIWNFKSIMAQNDSSHVKLVTNLRSPQSVLEQNESEITSVVMITSTFPMVRTRR